MIERPEISVCIFSYNFGDYLEQALDSVLSQQLSVPYDIVIGDDCSTDNSLQIIEDYVKRYPGIIRPIYNHENLGGTKNWLNTISACRGRYIALLDGDDFFIEPRKLQLQYEFLNLHSDYMVCFHAVREVYEDREMGEDKDVKFEQKIYRAGDMIERGWFIRTSSIFFRNGLLPESMPQWIFRYPYRLDSILPVFLCVHGPARYIDEIYSVWRKHSKGMSYHLLDDEINDILTRIRLSEDLDNYTNGEFRLYTEKRITDLYTSLFFSIVRSGSPLKYASLLLKALGEMNYSTVFKVVKDRIVGTKET